MDLLTGLIYVTVAIIVLVVAHGFYRKWVDRRNRVVVKLERNLPQADVDLELLPNSELPNGGARSIARESDPVIPRKRYQLKDGRDKVRQSEPEPGNVPVLMDPLEIDETTIEHTNVFVTAETSEQETAAVFHDEELPPEVLAGLDSEFHDSQPATAAHAAAPVAERALDETGLDDEDEDEQQAPHKQLHDKRLDEEDADEFIAAQADPLSEDDEFSDEFAEQFEGEFEEETNAALANEPVAAGVTADAQLADEEAAEADPAEDGNEDEEEYDPYEDENFYENEPALLENAYKLATSRFHREKEPEAPRIEPGFGEAQGEEVEAGEDFVSALNEDAMDEFLDKEREEIRAWRNQSVTQQDAPPVVPAPVPSKPVFEMRVESRTDSKVDSKVEKRIEQRAEPTFESNFAARQARESMPARVAAPIEPAVPVRMMEEPLPPPTLAQTPATKANTKTPEHKENKPGFWQSMTGKTAKSVIATTAKIAQGELFHAEPSAPQPAPPPVFSGPQEVVVVNVMAKPGQYFYGDEMLPVLQHYGLRLGQMNIFHRHTDVDGTGPVMFSMANMVKPGTFALNGIENFATPGISFFVQLPNRHGNMKAFEHMLATANGVKQAMDGILKDERRSVLTRQTVEHCRQRIRDFELALLAKK